jgi:flagellar FliL protein
MTTKVKKEAPPVEEAPPKKKSGKGRLFLFLAFAVIFGGGGVGAGLWAMGFLSTGATGEGGHRIPEPELVARDDASAAAVSEATEKVRNGGKIDPHVFQASYHEIPKGFTSNLKGGQAFVQIAIGMSTYYEKDVVLKRVEKHEMAIRSAILMVLAEQDPLVLATGEGKEKLRRALKDAVNSVLTIKEGFGGIEEVFFTNFVTQ